MSRKGRRAERNIILVECVVGGDGSGVRWEMESGGGGEEGQGVRERFLLQERGTTRNIDWLCCTSSSVSTNLDLQKSVFYVLVTLNKINPPKCYCSIIL